MTSDISKYFIETIEIIHNKERAPYYLESKIKDLSIILSADNIGDILHRIILGSRSVDCLRFFHKIKVMKDICPLLYNLYFVPQKKKKTKNAFEHTLKVLNQIPNDNIDLKWVAILHDTGKYDSYILDNNFNYHAKYSEQITKYFCSVYGVSNAYKIRSIVKNHMLPLDYQRDPNWGESSFLKLIKKCSPYTLDVIEFSFYDKKAENDVPEYLEPLIKLKEKVKKLI